MEIAPRFNFALMYLVMSCEKACISKYAKESVRVVSEGPQPASCSMIDKKQESPTTSARENRSRAAFEFSISFQEKTQFRVSLMIATIGD